MRLGIALGGLLALLAVPAVAITNPFAADEWQGLTNLDSPHGANWLRVYATSLAAPATIFAGFEGDGVYRSTDDGVTWSELNSGLNGDFAQTVRAIVTPQTGPVLAGTAHGIFKLDGDAWSPMAQGPEADPAHPKNLNQSVESILSPTGGNMLAGTAGAGVWTSQDSGATWAAPEAGNGMPAGTSVWGMVSVTGPSPASPIVLAATDNGVYRSNDFGATWMPRSDGIPFTTVLMVFADANNANILYAGTLGNGVYRSLDFGQSWAAVNGTGSHALGGGHKVQTMLQFPSASGTKKTRLYVGTQDGVWAGETGSGPHPGAIAWRHLTETGLHQTSPASDNVIFWALSEFLNDFPGTLLGGTQSNGGYALHMKPPTGPAPAVASSATIGDLHADDTLTATAAGWTGTPTIEFTWQWQRCTSAGGSCGDIEGATSAIYDLTDDDVGHKVQVVLTGHNDYPSFTDDALTRTTQLSDVVGAAQHPELEPGANSITTPDTPTSSNADAPITQVGDTLTASGWSFSPAATSRDFRWYRCIDPSSANPADGTDGCAIAATTDGTTYVTTADDLETYMCVVVIGTNQYGSASTPCSARTSNVVAPDPVLAQGSTPLVVGHPYVGATVTGSIGEYTFSPVRIAQRYWYVCNAQGDDCSSAASETIGSPTYPVAEHDLGSTLRFEALIDTNGNAAPPAAKYFRSPPSAPVTAAPPPPPPAFPIDPTPTPTPTPTPDPGSAAGGGGPGATPLPPTVGVVPVTPRLSSVSLVRKAVKRGGQVGLKYELTGAVSLAIRIQTRSTGHKVGHTCRSGKPKRGQHKCTIAKTVGGSTLATPKPSGTVSFKSSVKGRKLKAGTYSLVVTPRGPTGLEGSSKTLTLKVTSH